MLRLLALLAAASVVAAGCGATQRETGAGQTTAVEHTPARPAPTTVVAYFLRDGKVAPTPIRVPATRAVATAALIALLGSPPAGYETAIPADGRLVSLDIVDGVATATFAPELRDLPVAAEAQIVYTLTRFPSVKGVAFRLADGPLPILDERGAPLDTYATRADFEGETPPILVESPLPGDVVSSPIRVAGTSNVFEATSQLELVQDGTTIARMTVTASSGTGERGTFDVGLPYEGSGAATLVAYDRSAEDGSIQHRVEIPVTLR